MQWSLRYDAEERELRLVSTDFWNGKHERLEWRVLNGRGPAAERYNGWRVESAGIGAPFYAFESRDSHRVRIEPEGVSVLEEHVTCPRTTNRRRRCEHCGI